MTASEVGLDARNWSSRATSWVTTERLSVVLVPHLQGGQTGQSQRGRSSIEQMYDEPAGAVKELRDPEGSFSAPWAPVERVSRCS
jgi:hypothetical protein